MYTFNKRRRKANPWSVIQDAGPIILWLASAAALIGAVATYIWYVITRWEASQLTHVVEESVLVYPNIQAIMVLGGIALLFIGGIASVLLASTLMDFIERRRIAWDNKKIED